MIPAAQTTAYTADSLVASGRVLLVGYSIYNAHATDATLVQFRDGATTSAEQRLVVSVPAGASSVVMPGNGAIDFERGLFVDVTGGTPTVIPQYVTTTRIASMLALYDNATRDLDDIGLIKLMELAASLPPL